MQLDRNKTAIAFTVSLALFMESLDTTIINTAIPAISHSLQVNPIDLKIALISYLLSLAIFIPISGWIADKFGIKKVFMGGIIIFTLSSFWCGYTDNLLELIIARSLQGLGGSQMLPIGRLIIARTFARTDLINAMSRVVMVGALGMMLGPVFGGLITHYFSWRWIFWVNIPVGFFAILMVGYCLKESPRQTVPPLDKFGFILFGSGLAGLVFSLSAFSETHINSMNALFVMTISLLLLLGYVHHSHKQLHPIVKTALFQSRTFSVSVVGNLLSRFGFGGIPFLIPLLLQISLGYSALLSGFLLAPIAIGVLLVRPLTLHALRWLGFKKLLLLNTLLVSLSLITFSIITVNTPIYLIALFTLAFGFIISLQFSSMNSLAFSKISTENLSAATSIMSTVQQLSQSLGVATSALFISYFSSHSSSTVLFSIDVFRHTFIALGIITLLASVIFMRLKDHDGDEMISHPTIT